MRVSRIALVILLALGLAAPLLAGEPPGEPPPAAPGDGEEAKALPPKTPENGSSRAPEGLDLDLGAGGAAQLQFADGTTAQVKENSKARVSREKRPALRAPDSSQSLIDPNGEVDHGSQRFEQPQVLVVGHDPASTCDDGRGLFSKRPEL